MLPAGPTLQLLHWTRAPRRFLHRLLHHSCASLTQLGHNRCQSTSSPAWCDDKIIHSRRCRSFFGEPTVRADPRPNQNRLKAVACQTDQSIVPSAATNSAPFLRQIHRRRSHHNSRTRGIPRSRISIPDGPPHKAIDYPASRSSGQRRIAGREDPSTRQYFLLTV